MLRDIEALYSKGAISKGDFEAEKAKVSLSACFATFFSPESIRDFKRLFLRGLLVAKRLDSLDVHPRCEREFLDMNL